MTLPARNLHSLALFNLHYNFRARNNILIPLCTDLPVIIMTPGIDGVHTTLGAVSIDSHNDIVVVSTLDLFNIHGFKRINKTWSSHLIIVSFWSKSQLAILVGSHHVEMPISCKHRRMMLST